MRRGALLAAALLGFVACALPHAPPSRDLRPALRNSLMGQARGARLLALAAALQHANADLRLAAARILGRDYFLSVAEVAPLARALEDPEPRVQEAAAQALLLQYPLRLPLAPALRGDTAGAPAPTALGGDDPFTALPPLSAGNLEFLRSRRDRGPALPPLPRGPAYGSDPFRLPEQTTLGPNIPMPAGSLGVPPY